MQVIQGATRGANTLDMLFTNNPDLIHGYQLDDSVHLDQKLITIHTQIAKSSPCGKTGKTMLNDFRALDFFKENIDWDEVRNKLSAVD